MHLTKLEQDFLSQHGYSEVDVFDGRACSVKLGRSEMTRLGKRIQIKSPCEKANHRLKGKYGHCVQCNPAILAYQGRKHATLHIYIAGSKQGKLIKIGTSEDAHRRVNDVSKEAYAGCSDWVLLLLLEIFDAGACETRAHRRLSRYQSQIEYEKGGDKQVSRESFSCPYTVAARAVEKSIHPAQLVEGGVQYQSGDIAAYEF
tara:strand:+ start:660 stop:1265 length:606 start_codon:yes stop_codon:yes gene_type:complete